MQLYRSITERDAAEGANDICGALDRILGPRLIPPIHPRARVEQWLVHPVGPKQRVEAQSDMPALPVDLEQTITDLWRQAQKRVGDGMFNGRVFSAERMSPELITGHWTEFRRLVAQFERPALFAKLCLRPLSVNGILVCRDGVVFGQRSQQAIYQAGLWQLAPAGSVDPQAIRTDGTVDVVLQAALELREELGLPFDTVHEAEPIALIEHPISHVCDLGIALRTSLTAKDVLSAHALNANAEYESIRIVSRQEIEAFANWAGEAMAPQSRILLERLGWLTTS